MTGQLGCFGSASAAAPAPQLAEQCWQLVSVPVTHAAGTIAGERPSRPDRLAGAIPRARQNPGFPALSGGTHPDDLMPGTPSDRAPKEDL